MRRTVISFILSMLIIFSGVTQVYAVFDSADFNKNSEPLKLLRITPSGEDVPTERQVVFHFNRPVVPVGKMERDASGIPISIDPPLNCEWRWLNTSALACQLDEKSALIPSTKYTVTIKPGIKTEDGSTLENTVVHRFVTRRPKVDAYWFRTWKSPGTPYIQVRFNQAVERESVPEKLFFWTRGNRIDVLIVDDPEYVKESGYGPGHVWIIAPQKELPLDTEVDLNVEPGILPIVGKEQGVEDRTVVTFDTYPEFGFIGVECRDNDDDQIRITPRELFKELERCSPLNGAFMLFTAPVIKEEIRDNLKVSPDLAGGRTDYDPWENVYSYSRLNRPHSEGRLYSIPFPEVLRAYETYTLFAAPGSIRDEFGRPLKEGIDMKFMTDHRLPNYHLAHNFSVLEKGLDTELPLVITNLKKIELTYDAAWEKGIAKRQEKSIIPGEAEDISYRIPMKIRDLIPAKSGVVRGEFTTSPSVPERSIEDRWFFSQITPYNVQVKIGHFNTLVWVTDLATGLPVPDVAVEIFKGRFSSLFSRSGALSQGSTNIDGTAFMKGTIDLDPDLDLLESSYWDWIDGEHLFVRCTKGNDIAVVPLIRQFSLDMEGANSTYIGTYLRRRFGHIQTWGTTAQGVYKAGDTIKYKFYVRDQSNRMFVPPPTRGYNLTVIDPMGKEVHEVEELTLSEFGSYSGEFTVPKTGAVGWYVFTLSATYTKESWEPMRVLVSDFTPAPFRVTTDLNGELFMPGDTITVTTAARLHAGGPYVNAQTRVTAILRPSSFSPSDPRAKGFWFEVNRDDHSRTQTLSQTEGTVDEKGNLETQFTAGESSIIYGRISIESAVRDDRGKFIAGAASARYVGRDRFVGVDQKDWVLKQGNPAKLQVIVVDEKGKIVAGTPVNVTIERRETKATRVKGAGNAYLTQYVSSWIPESSCKVVSTVDPIDCTLTPEHTGTYRMTALIADTKGRTHSSTISRWVVGKGRVIWETAEGNGLNIFPEKEEIKVGETARYLVQNPFPGSKALITIERFGVLKSWIQTFNQSTEIIEFMVDPDMVPGYYLSVVVVSPRVEKPIDEQGVDLGKPTFRMGYVRVPVTDPYKEISVTVRPERDMYKPRERVRISLQANAVKKKAGAMKAPLTLSVSHRGQSAENSAVEEAEQPPMELAVVVIDEAVFDLIQGGKNYYDPYRGFYFLEPIDLRNFNLINLLIGRQKFEKKGANAGGDGGPDLSLRSLFKFVSYWNPSLRTDRNGRAEIEFEVPDNLTGWRVLAMAVTADDMMGLGDADFKVNLATEIRPVLPNQVTEGDEFKAGFSVMNRTEKMRNITVSVSAEGPLAQGQEQTVNKSIAADPYKRYTVWLPLKTSGDGEISFTVTAGDNENRDALRKTLPVRKRVSFEVAATYGTTTADSVEERFHFPNDIRTDTGRVSLVLAPSVIGNVTGAFEYMRDYPYICWEQQLTKGVMAAHYLNLRQYIPETFEWKDSAGLPEQTLKLAAEHQAPNGGMAYYIPRDEYVSPYLSAYTTISFNWLRQSGYAIPTQVEQKLHSYLLDLLRRDVMPTFFSRGMSSTVRAVALAALADNGKIGKSDVLRYRRRVKEMSLFGKAHYLLALIRIPGTEDVRREVFDMILSQANETGGKYIFSEDLDDGYKRILASTLRDNGAVLSALLAYGETTEGAGLVSDIPFKLVRTLTQTRGNRVHWENTQENMFCMNALIDYSRLYEKEKPDMKLKALLEKEPLGEARFTDFRDSMQELDRPIGKEDPGRKATLRIERKGEGRVYYAARLFYAPLEFKAKPVNAGIFVAREYSVERDEKWVLLKTPMELRTGELVRVDLYVSLPASRNFVVVDDPVPGGLEPVNRDLATASTVDADKAKFDRDGGSYWFRFDDWLDYGYSRWSFYHQELRHHAVRFYSDYLPAGNYHLSYVAQAIAPGTFTVMPVHAEEMYDPDVFGKGLPAVLDVERAD